MMDAAGRSRAYRGRGVLAALAVGLAVTLPSPPAVADSLDVAVAPLAAPPPEPAAPATVADSLAPRYAVGVMGEYALGALSTLSAGVFNGEGANATANRDSTVMWVARMAARPLPQLGLGGSFTRDGDDSLRWGVDASAQEHGGVVRAEYATRHV